MKKVMFIIGSIMLILLSSSLSGQESAEKMKRTVLRVQNIYCGSCLAKIEGALSGLNGYSGIGSNLKENLVAVDFKAPLTATQITAALAQIQYPARILSIQDIDSSQSFLNQSLKNQSAYGCRRSSVSGSRNVCDINNDGSINGKENLKRSCCSAEDISSAQNATQPQCYKPSGSCCGASASAWKALYRSFMEP